MDSFAIASDGMIKEMKQEQVDEFFNLKKSLTYPWGKRSMFAHLETSASMITCSSYLRANVVGR